MQFLGPKNRSVSSSTTYMDRDHGTYKATKIWKMCRACERNMFFMGEAMHSSSLPFQLVSIDSSFGVSLSIVQVELRHFPRLVSFSFIFMNCLHRFLSNRIFTLVFYAVGLSRPFLRWGDVANSVFRYQCSKDSTSRQIHEVQGGVDHPGSG